MDVKAYIIQPYYSFEEKDLQACFDGMIELLDRVGNVVGKYYKAHPAPSEVKTEK